MQVDHIRYFIRIANDGSISRAAEQLGLTHQNLGRIIRDMEKELGLTLFIRGRFGVSLTESGRYVYQRFQTMNSAYQEVSNYARNHNDKARVGNTTINLYISSNIMAPSFSSTIRSFSAQYPNTRLRVIERSNSQIIKALRDDREALGNIVVSQSIRDFDLRAHQLNILQQRPISLTLHLPLALSGGHQGGWNPGYGSAQRPVGDLCSGRFGGQSLLPGTFEPSAA